MRRQISKDAQAALSRHRRNSSEKSIVKYSKQLYYQNNERAFNEQDNELGYPENLIVGGHKRRPFV